MRTVTGAFVAAATLLGFLLGASFAQDIVNLSSKNLSAVPDDLPPTVEYLDLSCNRITALHTGDFKNTTSLRFLNMSWNSLGEIHPQTFLRTPLLESLDLSHNGLRNLSGQQFLLHTQNLLMLNLAHNEFFSMRLGSEFASLVKLTGLALGAKNINVGDFRNIGEFNLRKLCLSFDENPAYETGSLKDVQARRLQIALGGDPSIFHKMIDDALRHFEEVELLNLTGGYKNLSQQLTKCPEIYTSHLYIKYISIDWKDMTNLVSTCLQISIPHLTTSDIALYKLPYKDSPEVKTSNTTSFTANRVEVKNFFFDQEAVYNFFINMPVTKFALTEISLIHMTCPKSESPIQQVDFSHCALSDSIFSRVEDFEILECKTLVNVWKLNLVGNNLKSFKVLSERLQHMKSLQYLDASLNLLVYDGLEKCLWPSNITKMILNYNTLTEAVFKCLPNEIETLVLQNNEISVVPSSVLKLEKLSVLNLGGNRLRDLPVCDSFPGLSVLLLNLNSLHTPSVQNIGSCPKLKTLDVSENPFICTCPLRSFLSLGAKFEKDNNHTGIDLVGWPSAYHCAYPEALRNSTLNTVTILEISCNTALLAATILCPAVALILAGLLLCRRFDIPWYLNMIWVWTRAKHRARVRARREDQAGVEFHAFVSYSQHDAEWVQNSLLPNLEGPAGGLRICHHEKDFVPGKTIVQNIIACVEKSRRSVFVLSGHFVKSEWCHYELYFASHQHLSQGSDSVVLVLLEPLPQYLIPSKYYQLKSMMGRHTYLEWPQDRAKHRLFWANLRAALQANLPPAVVAEQQG
ncbi:toll-like receptor 1 [Nelusetta ayraudi]|uniref:toll-like receptor 1 n=1 Tax=Nelusetta ayraudi TaxID=303726 RepID=UPI003F7094C6